MDAADHPTDAFRARSAWIPILMSGAAMALLGGYLASGPHDPAIVIENGVRRPDESGVARLWQFLMVLQLPAIGWFALRWLPRAPRQAIAVLALQALAVVAAALPVFLIEQGETDFPTRDDRHKEPALSSERSGSMDFSHFTGSGQATRRDGWTPERKLAFLRELAVSGSVRGASATAGKSREAAYRLRRRDALFAQGWDEALGLARQAHSDNSRCCAIDGVLETVFYRGKPVGTRRRFDTRLLLAQLARLDRQVERLADPPDFISRTV